MKKTIWIVWEPNHDTPLLFQTEDEAYEYRRTRQAKFRVYRNIYVGSQEVTFDETK